MKTIPTGYPIGHWWLVDSWYKNSLIGTLLSPLGFIYASVVRLRKRLYDAGILKKHSVAVPVIVVGNITVGGTGKTPLIIRLAQILTKAGFQPGIISRGYGGQSDSWPQWVDNNSDAGQVGDEALLIAGQTGCPMAVAPTRIDAARMLLQQSACNVILSDDGLQHYALNRTIEIAVIDGERRFGNGYCLPAGPLREPVERLRSVDFIVVNGARKHENEFSMQLVGDSAVNLVTGEQKPLRDFTGIDCHALAGIGNPERFFKLLASAGLNCTTQPFPDHYKFQRNDIALHDNKPVLMTEKDAVKCLAFADNRHWYVPVKAVLDPVFSEQLLFLLNKKHEIKT